MARAAIRAHHRSMPVNTSRVTAGRSSQHGSSPVTGYAYLDAVLDQPGSVLAMAHRGGALHPEIPGTENTLHAFRHAVALGYRYLETDVHATSDGVLLAFHDAALDRVTDGIGLLAELTADEVARSPDRVASTRCRRWRSCSRSSRTAGSTSTSSPPERCAPLADLLDRTGSHDRVCVGSFSQRRLERLPPGDRRPGGHLGGSAPRSARSSALAVRTGGPVRDPCTRVAALQVPHRRGRLPVVTPGVRTTGPRAPARTCTCGPSTSPQRWTSCSTWAWTA